MKPLTSLQLAVLRALGSADRPNVLPLTTMQIGVFGIDLPTTALEAEYGRAAYSRLRSLAARGLVAPWIRCADGRRWILTPAGRAYLASVEGAQ